MPSLISFEKYDILNEINTKYANLKRVIKKYEEIKDKLEFYEVWYYSNKKKIKGFAIAPKSVAEKGSRSQSVIYNRGGTKDFDQLNTLYLLNHMGNWALNGYFVIGSQDKSVHPERVLDFITKLGKTNIDFEFYYLKDDHNFSNYRNFVDQKIFEWARQV